MAGCEVDYATVAELQRRIIVCAIYRLFTFVSRIWLCYKANNPSRTFDTRRFRGLALHTRRSPRGSHGPAFTVRFHTSLREKPRADVPSAVRRLEAADECVLRNPRRPGQLHGGPEARRPAGHLARGRARGLLRPGLPTGLEGQGRIRQGRRRCQSGE